MNNKKTILVKGAYGSCNFGDDLLMLTLNELLSKIDNVNVIFESNNQKYIYRLTHKKINLKRTDDRVNYDILIFGGGTQVFSFDFEIKNKTLEEKIRRIYRVFREPRKIWYKSKQIYLRSNIKYQKKDKETMGIGLGFGPFQSREEAKTKIQKKIGKRCSFLSVRDKASYYYVKKAGYSPLLSSDLCFLNDTDSFLPPLSERKFKKKIGIILRDWPTDNNGGASKKNIEQIKSELSRLKFDVTFISFSAFHDDNFRKNSQKNKHYNWNPNSKNSIKEMLQVLNEQSIIISSRYHGMIFSTLLGIPFIGVNIEPKISNYVNDTEFHNLIWNKPFETKNLLHHIKKITENYCYYLKEINKLNIKNKSLATKLRGDFLSNLRERAK